MITVKTAATAGFCFGVQRAVDKVYSLLDEPESAIYTLGPLIHNDEVVQDLAARGVRVIDEEDLDGISRGTIVIRSHGVGAAVYDHIRARGLELVDVTCPFVLKIHKIVREQSEKGNHVLIVGDETHPEVRGICGWCRGPYTVIRTEEEAERFEPPSGQQVCVVAQTTFNWNKFKDIVEILRKKRYDKHVLNIPEIYIILNTICSATEERQAEARQIAAEADTMLVVGGRHSSNTQKLYEICKAECKDTYYIQTPVDLDSDMFQRSSYVGITAGASTPKKIIEEVQRHVRKNF